MKLKHPETRIGESDLVGPSGLGAAVLLKAYRDARNPELSSEERTEAAAFFDLDNVLFRLWCACADVRPEMVVARLAGQLSTAQRHGLKMASLKGD